MAKPLDSSLALSYSVQYEWWAPNTPIIFSIWALVMVLMMDEIDTTRVRCTFSSALVLGLVSLNFIGYRQQSHRACRQWICIALCSSLFGAVACTRVRDLLRLIYSFEKQKLSGLRQSLMAWLHMLLSRKIRMCSELGVFFRAEQLACMVYMARACFCTLGKLPLVTNPNDVERMSDLIIIFQMSNQAIECPYLGTIRRHLLDFDFEKVCCISLSNVNVYGCLVCGRYFQGKGKTTHAYTHSLQQNHHLFMNLQSGCVYCLPDGYQVLSPCLSDIRYNLLPVYNPQTSQQLDQSLQPCQSLSGKQYIPGCVGLNNLKNTEYVNVVVQMLSRVKQVREMGLFGAPKGLLSEKLAMLMKKMWNNRNFKGVVSPHEFIQALAEASQKKFRMGKQEDPMALLLWIINHLELEMKQNKVKGKLLSLFRGKLKTSFFKAREKSEGYDELPSKVEEMPFLVLPIEVPQTKSQLPNDRNRTFNQLGRGDKMFGLSQQHMLKTLLQRFLGKAPQDTPQGRKFFLLTSYPDYLLLHFKRFTFNGFFKQKNCNLVLFPLQMELEGHLYRLIANICHEGGVDSHSYKIHVRRAEKWFVIQDLTVDRVSPDEVIRSEAYIQLYEKA